MVWPAVDGDEGGVVIAAMWGAGCGVEGGGDVVMVLEAVAAAARVGTEVVNVLVSKFNHGSTFCKISMLHVPPENNEFEGEIIPCSDFRLGTSQPRG
nr:hypothetical protein [Tanacetum cinerariifolium]